MMYRLRPFLQSLVLALAGALGTSQRARPERTDQDFRWASSRGRGRHRCAYRRGEDPGQSRPAGRRREPARCVHRIAVQALKASEPNGQTLLVAPDAIVTLFPHVFREVGYDPFKDLTPISQVLWWSFGFAVPAASPAKTFAEFVALAKSDPKYAMFARRRPEAASMCWACNLLA